LNADFIDNLEYESAYNEVMNESVTATSEIISAGLMAVIIMSYGLFVNRFLPWGIAKRWHFCYSVQ